MSIENEAREAHAAFEAAVRPLIKWLNENEDTHTSIIVTTTTAELLRGFRAVVTYEYVKD